MFGENLGFLLKESKIFSLSNTGIITMFHPEAYLNPRFRGNNFKTGCRYLDDLWTEVLIYLTCNKSIKCSVGSGLFNEVKDTKAYKLMNVPKRL